MNVVKSLDLQLLGADDGKNCHRVSVAPPSHLKVKMSPLRHLPSTPEGLICDKQQALVVSVQEPRWTAK